MNRKERRQVIEAKRTEWPVTGYELDLLQDANSGLSKWFASQPNARQEVREVTQQIQESK